MEAHDEHEAAEQSSDVIVLLGAVKDLAFSASDLECPHMQSAQVWKDLVLAQQQQHEDIVDHCQHFVNWVEITEGICGEIALAKIVEKDAKHAKNKAKVLAVEREKFMAPMFLDGADKKVFGHLMKSLRNNFLLGDDKCPVMMEDTLQVLAVNQTT